MYFVTDEPRLFNTENGNVTGIVVSLQLNFDYEVRLNNAPVFGGTRQECEDFIYSIAGWVGAVNPVGVKKDE